MYLRSVSNFLPVAKAKCEEEEVILQLWHLLLNPDWKNDLLEQSRDLKNPGNLSLKQLCVLEKEGACCWGLGGDGPKSRGLHSEVCQLLSPIERNCWS